jgi:CubicO group peptidase (beta-lactamase class C family)
MINLNLVAASCFETNSNNTIESELEVLIDSTIKNHIKEYNIPLVSVLVGNNKKILYKDIYSSKGQAPLGINTIFDLASITKVFTAASVLKVLEEKKIDENEYISNLYPKLFKSRSKSILTYADLLKHSSGFRSGTGVAVFVSDIEKTWNNILGIEPKYEYGKFKYSDINYLVLGRVIEKLSKTSLNSYIEKNIFTKTNMTNTSFNPYLTNNCKTKCAPTSSKFKLGLVHDSTSRNLGGITGHAGIFSTLTDMSKFASLFLNNGSFCNNQVLSKKIITKMTKLDSNTGRGLGFDMLSPYSKRPRGPYFNKGKSFGHTGFTGTSLWIDPTKNMFVILLTNSVYAADEKKSKKGFLTLNLELSKLIGKFYSYK